MENINVSPEDLAKKPWDFVADYSDVMTPEEAERELNGFDFKGVGWYFLNRDSVLVIPISTDKFLFSFYINRNPMKAFNWVINEAPIRLDVFGRYENGEVRNQYIVDAVNDVDINFFGE